MIYKRDISRPYCRQAWNGMVPDSQQMILDDARSYIDQSHSSCCTSASNTRSIAEGPHRVVAVCTNLVSSRVAGVPFLCHHGSRNSGHDNDARTGTVGGGVFSLAWSYR